MEKVGILEKVGSVFIIWRDADKYFVEAGGELREYSTPADLEEWAEERLKEGYKLKLELVLEKVEYTDLDAVVGGVPLRAWYEKVLSFGGDRWSEYQCVGLWAIHENMNEAIKRLEEIEEWLWLEDGWKGWRWENLLKWEKEKLKECFVKVIEEVWRLSWEIIRFVLSDKPQALAKDWRKGKPSRGTIEEAMLQIAKIGRERDVVKDLVKKMVEGENEEWKEWLAKMVWLNLAEEMME
jgi:hypothetical protein